jgi:serine/threonine protein kinase
MGVVWRARDEFLHRDVAVKAQAWPSYYSPEEQRALWHRAAREAEMAARVSHRNVIRVFDITEQDGRPWIVMELLPPTSLHDLIETEGPLGPVLAARVGLGILAALRAAHARGIVHQDVKPANILLSPDRVVLTDFGIAQAAGAPALNAAGLLVGSPSYISPERARGAPCGPPADLWGLGASLYAAVTGHGPFDRDGGAVESLAAAVADEPEPAAGAGPLLWTAISGLLRKDPGLRLNAAEAERMLRLATSPGAGIPRQRRSPAPGPRPARPAARAVPPTVPDVLGGAAPRSGREPTRVMRLCPADA